MIIETFQRLQIQYKQVEHPAYFTMEDALKIESLIEGQMCKNLFVRTRQEYFILVLKGDKRANLRKVSKLLGVSHLHFGTDEELESLHLYSGCVNPLSICFDTDHKVKVLMDQELENQLLLFHPNDNTTTVSIPYSDLLRYLEYYQHTCTLLDLE